MSDFALNEIELTVRKAALGQGLDFGRADDLGRAASWLCARGIDGATAAYHALEGLDRNRACHFGGKARVAIEGFAAIDLLKAGELSTIDLIEPDSAQLIEGLIAIQAQQPPQLAMTELASGSICLSAQAPDERPVINHRWQPDATHWKYLLRLAAKTYVPASELSRQGAGAGQIDRD